MVQSVQLHPSLWMVVESGFKSRLGSRSVLRPTHRPVHLAPGLIYLEVKWPRRVATPPSSAEVKIEWIYLYTHQCTIYLPHVAFD
jgi:hypothetical protein